MINFYGQIFEVGKYLVSMMIFFHNKNDKNRKFVPVQISTKIFRNVLFDQNK